MRKRRYQTGSLQQRRRGRAKTWHVLWWDGPVRRTHTFDPQPADRHEAERMRAEFMRGINGTDTAQRRLRVPTLREFIEEIYLPEMRKHWKDSSRTTAENRIQKHVVGIIGPESLSRITLSGLQDYLSARAETKLGESMVKHLRFDLRSILGMAHAEGVIDRNPADELRTPKRLPATARLVMTAEQVTAALAALPLRERTILRLAVFVGMRPGEILALRRRHIATDCTAIEIEERVYRAKMDTPKTRRGTRLAAVAPDTAADLREWMKDKSVCTEPDSHLFVGRDGRSPASPASILDHIHTPLAKIGLDWVDFHVLRRTQASLGHSIDAKVMADQRGHGIGVALDTYTKSDLKAKTRAVTALEKSVKPKRKSA